jgi:uncharacterized protein YegP (UPF0339 family)
MAGEAKFEYYVAPKEPPDPDGPEVQTIAGEWRWRLRAANGEIVASGEGYSSEQHVKDGIKALVAAVDAATRWHPEADPFVPDTWRIEKVDA